MKRVLLVDDDDDLREAFCDLLAFGGCDVAGVAGGSEALAWLKENRRPNLILLDLMMPGMSGAELKARLDVDPALRMIPVVVLSGDTRVAEQAARMGAVGWMSKPVSMDMLFEVVDRYAGTSSSESG